VAPAGIAAIEDLRVRRRRRARHPPAEMRDEQVEAPDSATDTPARLVTLLRQRPTREQRTSEPG